MPKVKFQTQVVPEYLSCHHPEIGSGEIEAVVSTLRSGRIGGNGPVSWSLESLLKEKLKAPYAFATSSGTHALEMALMGLGICPGDEVIVPSFTFVSTANAVVRMGAVPVFADVEPRHLTLDPFSVESLIRKQTKAVIAVHYAGLPCQMKQLLSLCRKRGLPLIEDAAQAVGSQWNGRYLGTLGTCGILSFHETKNITCGEGGAFLTSQRAVALKADLLREKGTNRTAFLQGRVLKYEWRAVGSSFILSDILAALALAQLRRLDELIQARRAIGMKYLVAFEPLERKGLLRLSRPESSEEWNWHIFFLLFPSARIRNRVKEALSAQGIGASTHFPPLHLSPYARTRWKYRPGDLPATEQASKTILRLPMYASLSEAAVDHVIGSVHQAVASAS